MRRFMFGLAAAMCIGAADPFLVDSTSGFVSAPWNQGDAAAAFDGENYFVVWEDTRNDGWDIYGARVDTAGSLLDLTAIEVSADGWGELDPDVAFDGSNFLVVWERAGDIWARRVSRAGLVLDPDPIYVCSLATGQQSPAVCFGGTDYLVAWGDYRNGGYRTDLYAARVTTAGVVLDPDGIPVSTAAGHQGSPAVAHDGLNYLVVWGDWRGNEIDIYASRVTNSGQVLDTAGIAVTTDTARQHYPSVTFGGEYFLVAWTDSRPARGTDIYAARVSRSGQVMDVNGLPVATTDGYEGGTDVAYDGCNYLVSFGGRYYETYVARVEESGHCLDPDGLLVSISADGGSGTSVVFDGRNYWVVWDDFTDPGYRDVYGARVSPWGEVLDSTSILATTAAFHEDWPAASSDGTGYLVAWQDFRNGMQSDIYAARVDAGGTVLDPVPFPVCSAGLRQIRPCAAFADPHHLVAWSDGRDSVYSVWAARVNAQGQVLDPGGIRVTDDHAYEPVAAGGNGQFLLVWEADYDIFGARVDTAGVVLDPQGVDICTVAAQVLDPAVAAGDSGYVVVWSDYRRSDTLVEADIYAARVTWAGEVLDPDGLPIAFEDSCLEADPAIAYGDGRYLVAWWVESPEPQGLRAVRVSQQGVVLDSLSIVLSLDYGTGLAAVFDGAEYLLAWQQSGEIRGARVSPDGVLLDTFPVARLDGEQHSPALAATRTGPALACFVSRVDSLGGMSARVDRVWANLSPFVGLRGIPRCRPVVPAGPSIVRGILPLTDRHEAVLLDICGRRVLDLLPGPNDVSDLAPGVYFMRQVGRDGRPTIGKVVVLR